MAIPAEEWLHLAKRLPVGRSERVQHRFESRQNMVVRNKPEGWASYCHACGEGGFVPKDYVKVAPEEPKTIRQALPTDLQKLEQAPGTEQAKVYRFLASKGIDRVHLQEAVCLYSTKAQRLVLGLRSPAGAAYLGRSVAGVQPKWVQYSDPIAGYPAYIVIGEGSRVVITEDVLSALKVRWACPDVQAVCSLGTKLSDSLVLYLVRRGVPVTLFYDGDPAGVSGAERGKRRLRGLGQAAEAATVHAKDPKDLHAQEIREVLNGTV